MWAFARRERTIAVRTGRITTDRYAAAGLAGAITLVALGLCDWNGWDRATVLGNQRFGLLVFGLLVAGVMVWGLSIAVGPVATAIPAERDRRCLDALLASRFAAADIVLGVLLAGAIRFALGGLAMLPVVVLVATLGGVDPGWWPLAIAGLVPTVATMGAVGIVASLGARSAQRAQGVAASVLLAWYAIPPVLSLILPLLWPGRPGWLGGLARTLGAGSPVVLALDLARIFPRSATPAEAVARLAAWQGGVALILVAWAICRLRPACRRLDDVEGTTTRLQQLRAALRRPPRRPSVGDDPCFWLAAYGLEAVGVGRRLAQGASTAGGLALLAWVTSWFALPAFAELVARGYRAVPEAGAPPEVSPFLRAIIVRLLPQASSLLTPQPGTARLDFNIVIRQFTGLFAMTVNCQVLALAAASIATERRRDTWLGLIATPLSAEAIVQGKRLGALFRSRRAAAVLVLLWTLGLAAGSIHPLGYLAGLASLAVALVAGATAGLHGIIHRIEVETAGRERLTPAQRVAAIPVAATAFAALLLGPPVALLTYEDVAAIARGGAFPPLRGSDVEPYLGARSVAAAWLMGMLYLGAGSAWLHRRTIRRFDAAIGRPVRPAPGGQG